MIIANPEIFNIDSKNCQKTDLDFLKAPSFWSPETAVTSEMLKGVVGVKSSQLI